MIEKNFVSPEELRNLIGDRAIFIWGARHEGYATATVLTRNGFTAAGFIDSSPSLQGTMAFGMSIDLPDSFFATHSAATAFIIIPVPQEIILFAQRAELVTVSHSKLQYKPHYSSNSNKYSNKVLQVHNFHLRRFV